METDARGLRTELVLRRRRGEIDSTPANVSLEATSGRSECAPRDARWRFVMIRLQLNLGVRQWRSMDPRAQRTVIDSANWQVTIGWTAGVVLSLFRAVTLATLVLADTPPAMAVIAQLAIEAVLSAALTFGVYRSSLAAALALFALWALGLIYAWVVSGRLLPPLGLIEVLMAIGLFQGIRGTLRLRELADSGAPAA
jgi:hypothetical protein